MRGSLICMIGIDGSGKTTLSKQVVQELQARGIRSRHVWGGFAPTLLLRLILGLAKALVYRENYHSQVLEHKGRVLNNRTLAVMYHHIVLVDHVLQIAIRVQFPLLFGQTVVCDRYIYDAVITTGLALDYSDDRLLRLLVRMQRLVPHPDQVLVMDLPEEVAFARKDDTVSVAFLSERRRRYHLIAEALGLAMLDARQPLEILAKRTTAQVLQLCQEGHPLCKYS